MTAKIIRCLALLLFTACLAPHAWADGKYHYADPAALHFEQFLVQPPANDSSITKSELIGMLELQRLRTDAEIMRAKSEEHLAIGAFASTLGTWFDEKKLPLTAKLLTQVKEDCKLSSELQKNYWNRPRPFALEPRLHPCVEKPDNASYPSGHSELAVTWGLVLAELVPDERQQILARAWQVGDDRVLAGVHYPSDVAAGRLAAQELFELMQKSPEFQTDLAAAQREVAAAHPGKLSLAQ
ncbi:MAG: phosphatase PAP2 family protein [Verrucomicrobiales bacterium]|jgi:acid phosphatase (class A)|nr:phosphatase PAP2 family protein [Verrucomicrobiales bacterium]